MPSLWVRLTWLKATWTQGRSDGTEIDSCATDYEATGGNRLQRYNHKGWRMRKELHECQRSRIFPSLPKGGFYPMVWSFVYLQSMAMSRLFDSIRHCHLVMLVYVGCFPRIADPHIWHRHCSQIPVFLYHIRRQMAFLLLVFVM
jgi:hypothetical protein